MTDSRIVIAGVPRSGKTTLSSNLCHASEGITLLHSDNLKHLDWSEQSRVAMHWLDEPGPWICEGITMIRALRKWMVEHHDEPYAKPCDVLHWLGFMLELETSEGSIVARQRALGKGCQGIYNRIHPDLISRGVEIVIH